MALGFIDPFTKNINCKYSATIMENTHLARQRSLRAWTDIIDVNFKGQSIAIHRTELLLTQARRIVWTHQQTIYEVAGISINSGGNQRQGVANFEFQTW